MRRKHALIWNGPVTTNSDDSAATPAESETTSGAAVGIPMGARLKRAREARGLSAQQVAQSLRLDLQVIEALERDDYSRLPALTFVRGYLHNYARLVDVDEAAIAQALPDAGATPAQALQRRAVAKHRSVRPALPWGKWLQRLVILVVLAAVLAWLYPMALEWWQDRDLAETDTTGEQLALPARPVVPSPTPPTTVPEQEPTLALPLPIPSSAPPAPVAKIEITPPATAVVPVPEPPAAAPQVDLVLVFVGDSWAEVRDSQRRLLFEMVRAGSRKALKGTPPFQLLLGNAPGVQVEYRGQAFDHSPHSRGNVARFTLD